MASRKEHWFRIATRYAVSGTPTLAFPGFVVASLDSAWQNKMGWAVFWILIGWLVAIIGTWVAEPLVDAKTRHRILATGVVAIIATILSGGVYFYETGEAGSWQPTPDRSKKA